MGDATIVNKNGAFGQDVTNADGTTSARSQAAAASRTVEWRIADEALVEGQIVALSGATGNVELPGSSGSGLIIGVTLDNAATGDEVAICVHGVCDVINDAVAGSAGATFTGDTDGSVVTPGTGTLCGVLLEATATDTPTKVYVRPAAT